MWTWCALISRTLEWLWYWFLLLLETEKQPHLKKGRTNRFSLYRCRRRGSSRSLSWCTPGVLWNYAACSHSSAEPHTIWPHLSESCMTSPQRAHWCTCYSTVRLFTEPTFILWHILITSPHISIKASLRGGRRTHEGESTCDQRRPQWLVTQFKSVRTSLNIAQGSVLEEEAELFLWLACLQAGEFISDRVDYNEMSKHTINKCSWQEVFFMMLASCYHSDQQQ